MVAKPRLRARAAQGFTYLALLFFMAIMGAALALTGIVWHVAKQREKEQELLFVGTQFINAIASYYRESPGLRTFPRQLTDLVKDPRFPNTKRHLRKMYRDPMTNAAEWAVVRTVDGGIIGVRSLSEQEPIRKSFPDGPFKGFAGKARYADWQFVYLPIVPRAPVPNTSVQSVNPG